LGFFETSLTVQNDRIFAPILKALSDQIKSNPNPFSTAVTVGAIGVKVLCSNPPCSYTVSVRTGGTAVATTLVASSLVSSYSISTASSATPTEETVVPFAPFTLTTGKTYWVSMFFRRMGGQSSTLKSYFGAIAYPSIAEGAPQPFFYFSLHTKNSTK
jgi:hypothetical protein